MSNSGVKYRVIATRSLGKRAKIPSQPGVKFIIGALPDFLQVKLDALDISLEDLTLTLPRFDRRIASYDPVPTRAMFEAIGGEATLPQGDYIQHRQMDVGYQIARSLHPQRTLQRSGSVDGIWVFSDYQPKRKGKPDQYKLYTVDWDGIGNPPQGVSTSTFSQVFAPDCYTWAVYFLVNGIPSEAQWFPIPSRYPEWNSFGIGPEVPEYNLDL